MGSCKIAFLFCLLLKNEDFFACKAAIWFWFHFCIWWCWSDLIVLHSVWKLWILLFLVEFFKRWYCNAKNHMYEEKKNWFIGKTSPHLLILLVVSSVTFLLHCIICCNFFFPLRKICFVVNCKTCPRNGEKS